MSDRKVRRFTGPDIDVFWDSRLCIHMAECGQAKGDLFVSGREPWCVPERASISEVREIVERCPSGALTYQDKVAGPEQPLPENTIAVAYNGPLFVSGDLAIEGAPQDMPGVRFRAALCRCGHSKNKPFCDNSHEQAGFRDFGSVGERGGESGPAGGTLAIKPLQDGPLLLSGPVTIRAGSGRKAWYGDRVALCRCGHSKNKPFCDGSHKAVGFKSD
ncbi:MAG: CDGSH iron-sulfur domain-containing protein [Gammaproteobacteria bacterium]